MAYIKTYTIDGISIATGCQGFQFNAYRIRLLIKHSHSIFQS